MVNIRFLHELQMYAKTSGSKMTVAEAASGYLTFFLEDCMHTPFRDLIPLEYTLRGMLDWDILTENQQFIIADLLQEIGIAEAEEAAMLKDCIGPEEDYSIPLPF